MYALFFLLITTSGVNSLLLPASPMGMTTPFSLAKNAEALFYNPANVQASEQYQVWCSYNRFYLSMQSVSLALSKQIKSIGIGLAFVNFDYGDIEWRPPYPTEDPVTYYSANDFLIVLGGNVRVSEFGKIGLNIKYISENIYIYADYTIAFDICFAYATEKNGLSFGVSDLGGQITLYNEAVNLPARISLGGFFSIRKLILSTDLHYLVNNSVLEFSTGVGYPVHEKILINASAHYREEFYPGFGIEINPGKIGIKYGGALYPKNLGMINTLGVGFEF